MKTINNRRLLKIVNYVFVKKIDYCCFIDKKKVPKAAANAPDVKAKKNLDKNVAPDESIKNKNVAHPELVKNAAVPKEVDVSKKAAAPKKAKELKKAVVPKKADESQKAGVPKKPDASKKAHVPKKARELKKEADKQKAAKSPELKTAEELPKTAESSQQTLSKMNPMIQIKKGLACAEDYTGEEIAILEPGDTFPLEQDVYV